MSCLLKQNKTDQKKSKVRRLSERDRSKVERKFRKSIMFYLKTKHKKKCWLALWRIHKRFEKDASISFKTITADNGSEF